MTWIRNTLTQLALTFMHATLTKARAHGPPLLNDTAISFLGIGRHCEQSSS